MSVPASILRRLYVKGSLVNTNTGFKFTLKNILADATIVKPISITVDGNTVDTNKVKLVAEGRVLANHEISESNTLDFNVNTSIDIVVEGVQLKPGSHVIVITTSTREYGDIKFDIKETVK